MDATYMYTSSRTVVHIKWTYRIVSVTQLMSHFHWLYVNRFKTKIWQWSNFRHLIYFQPLMYEVNIIITNFDRNDMFVVHSVHWPSNIILLKLKMISPYNQNRTRPACTSKQSDLALYCCLVNFKFSSWYHQNW